MTNLNIIDLNDILFRNKNKDYGAFELRKKYPKIARIAMILGIIVFSFGTVGPFAYDRYVEWRDANKPKAPARKVVKSVELIEADNLKDKNKQEEKQVAPVEEAKPAVSTVQFLPPVVKPDALVTEEFIPTQEEMQFKDPGKITQEGTGQYTLDVGDMLSVEQSNVVGANEDKTEKEEVFTFAEEMPSFPGGDEELYAYIAQNIQYPEIAKKAGTEGKVIVEFTVGKDGRVSNVKVIKGIGAGCDEEAVRVIRSMPKWNPGKQNGVAVPVRITVPIQFKLTN